MVSVKTVRQRPPLLPRASTPLSCRYCLVITGWDGIRRAGYSYTRVATQEYKSTVEAGTRLPPGSGYHQALEASDFNRSPSHFPAAYGYATVEDYYSPPGRRHTRVGHPDKLRMSANRQSHHSNRREATHVSGAVWPDWRGVSTLGSQP